MEKTLKFKVGDKVACSTIDSYNGKIGIVDRTTNTIYAYRVKFNDGINGFRESELRELTPLEELL